MFILQMVVDLYLPGCHSLKEKRSRTLKLKDRFGKHSHVAVCESGRQDNHQQSQWTVLIINSDKMVVQQTLSGIERDIQLHVDGEVCGVVTDWL